MGTNYYWFKEEIKGKNIFPDAGLHVGKLSCGWVFHFQAYPELSLTSFSAYKKLLKEGFIYDEYNNRISYKKFIKLIKSTLPDGVTHESEDDGNNQLRLAGFFEWLDEGFIFSIGDFS